MEQKRLPKNAGLADWAFIAIIVAGSWLVGTVAPMITKKPDTPAEQLAEKIIKLESGQEVDFSAHIKKDADGKVTMTDTVVTPKN